MNILKNPKIQFSLLLLLAILTYSAVLSSTYFVNPDAQFIFPILYKVESLTDYLSKLFTFNTLDFQPVRDLTLYFDMKILEFTGLNSSIAQNLIYWVISCWVVNRTLKKIFKNLSEQEIFFITAAFLVYPLFTSSVSWGIARKHILAFMFTMLATENFLSDTRSSIKINLYYFLGVLSQPICLLWAVWALIYDYVLRSDQIRKNLSILIPAMLIFIVGLVVNTLYYTSSPVFLASYGAKTGEILEISDKSIALGHYIFQLFFPYLMGFNYSLGHWSALAGLMILGVFLYLMIGLKLERKDILLWLMFILFPIAIIITKSSQLYDTYLLIPAFGILVLLLKIKEKCPSFKFKSAVYAILIVGWMGFSFSESRGWTDEILLTKRNFERRPSCASAYEFLRISYENAKPPQTPTARNFIYQHECDNIIGSSLANLKANILFYENDMPVDQRITQLNKLVDFGIYPNMTLVAFYIKLKNFSEAQRALDLMEVKYGNQKFKDEYIPIAAEFIQPYCAENLLNKCQEMMKPFITKKSGLTYK